MLAWLVGHPRVHRIRGEGLSATLGSEIDNHWQRLHFGPGDVEAGVPRSPAGQRKAHAHWRMLQRTSACCADQPDNSTLDSQNGMRPYRRFGCGTEHDGSKLCDGLILQPKGRKVAA